MAEIIRIRFEWEHDFPHFYNPNVADWRLAVIRDALAHPARSRARADAVKRLSKIVRIWPRGGIRPASVSSIRLWIRRYEDRGFRGLWPKEPARPRRRPVLISRKWDRTVPFEGETRWWIFLQLRRLVMNSPAGWRATIEAASEFLATMTRQAGYDPGPERLQAVCRLPRCFIDRTWESR